MIATPPPIAAAGDDEPVPPQDAGVQLVERKSGNEMFVDADRAIDSGSDESKSSRTSSSTRRRSQAASGPANKTLAVRGSRAAMS